MKRLSLLLCLFVLAIPFVVSAFTDNNEKKEEHVPIDALERIEEHTISAQGVENFQNWAQDFYNKHAEEYYGGTDYTPASEKFPESKDINTLAADYFEEHHNEDKYYSLYLFYQNQYINQIGTTSYNDIDSVVYAKLNAYKQVNNLCNIKGNITLDGEKIYHTPSNEYYEETIINPDYGEQWFCTEEEAELAGWRRAFK